MKDVCASLILIFGFLGLNSGAVTPPSAPQNFHLLVPGAPAISTPPANATVMVGQNVTFTATASGAVPLAYQWTFNGVNVGSGNSSYTRTGCQLSDNGGQVRVTVINSMGSSQSSLATLTVNPNIPNYFAGPAGSSSNSGLSTNSSWSLSYALSMAGPSNMITLLPGTYPSIQITASGTTLRSQIKWGARVVGSPGTHGVVTVAGVSNVIVDGLEVAYSYIDGVKFNGPNNTVRNCWIHHAGKGDPNAVVNTNSSFTGQGVSAHDQYGTIVENNLIENCGVWLRHDHRIYLNGTNCVIRNNVIRDNLQYGVQLYDYPNECSGIQVYNNLIYNNNSGLTVWADSGYTNYVYNNTIVVASNYCVVSMYGHLLAKNNILAVQSGWWPTVDPENGSVVETDYNLVNKSPQSPYPGGPHDVVASQPGFVKFANGLYWLSSTSPARNAGNPQIASPVDFFGRSGTAVRDIGAFQYSDVLAADTRVLDPITPGSDYWSVY